GLTATCRSRRRAAVISRLFLRRVHLAEIKMCSRSNPSALLATRKALVAASAVSRVCSAVSRVWAHPSRAAFHAETLLPRPPKRNLRLGLSANSHVRVAVESGLESANRFDLRG